MPGPRHDVENVHPESVGFRVTEHRRGAAIPRENVTVERKQGHGVARVPEQAREAAGIQIRTDPIGDVYNGDHHAVHAVPIPEERLDPERLMQDLRASGKSAAYLADADAIVDYCAKNAQGSEIICVFSNGGFGNIHAKLLDRLRYRK